MQAAPDLLAGICNGNGNNRITTKWKQPLFDWAKFFKSIFTKI